MSRRNILSVISLATFLFFLFGCYDNNKKSETPSEKPPCLPDSIRIKQALFNQKTDKEFQQQLLTFYRKRNFSPVWIDAGSLNENAGKLINLLSNEESANTFWNENSLHELYLRLLADTSRWCYNDSLSVRFETSMTLGFFEYVKRNLRGVGDDILKQVNWYITRNELNYEEVLADFLSSSEKNTVNAPVYPQYHLLKNYLRKYNEMDLLGGWLTLEPRKGKIQKGDSLRMIAAVKHQLYLMEDMQQLDTTYRFNDSLEVGMMRFQKRHGLKPDGVIGGKTWQALKTSCTERIQQILVNMERCRWVPLEMKGDFIIVNIPQFRLQVYENNRPVWSCNVIVGKANTLNNTVIFNDSLEFIVFSPYWNIPENILFKEIIPAIKKNPNYLEKNNMEVIGKSGNPIDPSKIDWGKYKEDFPYIVREKPGVNNSLGLVKFLFPNPYDIYMHDTPAKSLFNESSRAFSHGCIRVEDPLCLAEFLLRKDKAWPEEKIKTAMEGGKETYVKLKKKIPVFITYFTAWVDESGKLNFRDDVYGHDERLSHVLFRER